MRVEGDGGDNGFDLSLLDSRSLPWLGQGKDYCCREMGTRTLVPEKSVSNWGDRRNKGPDVPRVPVVQLQGYFS